MIRIDEGNNRRCTGMTHNFQRRQVAIGKPNPLQTKLNDFALIDRLYFFIKHDPSSNKRKMADMLWLAYLPSLHHNVSGYLCMFNLLFTQASDIQQHEPSFFLVNGT